MSSHEDLFATVEALKSSPNITRVDLLAALQKQPHGQEAQASATEHAINLAVRVMLMVNCSAQRQPTGLLERGVYRLQWRSDITFAQFVTNAFPTTDHPSLNDDESRSSVGIRAALMARKLKKRAGLKLRPTDDLRSHLQLDRKSGFVDIFHHAGFLKEQLRLSKDLPRNLLVDEALKV